MLVFDDYGLMAPDKTGGGEGVFDVVRKYTWLFEPFDGRKQFMPVSVIGGGH